MEGKEVVFTTKQIEEGVERVAKILDRKFAGEAYSPIFLSILQGGDMFCKDLMKQVDFVYQYDTIEAKSYEGVEQKEVRIINQPTNDLHNRKIILVDDFCDSGNTIEKVSKYLRECEVQEITIVTFLYKKKHDYTSIIHAYQVTNDDWLYGYGLDLNGKYRGEREIFKLNK